MDARRQHRDFRVALAGGRRHRLQRLQKHSGYCPTGATRWLREELREEMHHRLAVLQHVGDAGGRAEIVLEHVESFSLDPHDVDADDMAVDVERRIVPDHLGQEGRRCRGPARRDAPGADDLLAVIDVVEEGVQRPHALLDAALKQPPFGGRDDARDEVEGDQPLERVLGAVDGEGDAEPPEENLGFLLLALKAGPATGLQAIQQQASSSDGPRHRRPTSR